MQFNLEINRDQYAIRAYGPGTVTVTIPQGAADPAPEALDAIGPEASRVRQEILSHSAVITPTRLLRNWVPQSFEELDPSHMMILVELAPEIVILGVGASLRWPASSIVAPLAAAGIGLEVMNTAAACRTYNILASESRKVVAAILVE